MWNFDGADELLGRNPVSTAATGHGSPPRASQGGHLTVPLLHWRPGHGAVAEADRLVQTGELHLRQLRAALQWCRG